MATMARSIGLTASCMGEEVGTRAETQRKGSPGQIRGGSLTSDSTLITMDDL
jgi:hypothetical protein